MCTTPLNHRSRKFHCSALDILLNYHRISWIIAVWACNSTSSNLVLRICVIELDHHWFRSWLLVCLVPSHYLNLWWLFIRHTPRNRLQWKKYWNYQVSLKKLHLNLSFVMLLPFWGGDGLPIRDGMYFHVEYIPWNTLLCFVLLYFL